MHLEPQTLEETCRVGSMLFNGRSVLMNSCLFQSLYEEARIWRRLDHPNLLPFLGITLDVGLSPALISPLCASGPIMKYLQHTPKDPKERLQMVGLVIEAISVCN